MRKRVNPLSFEARLYIAIVVAIGASVVASSIYALVLDPPERQWLYLAFLTFLTGSFSIKLPSISARISVSEAFVFAAVYFFGPSGATVIVACDTLIMMGWSYRSSVGTRHRVRALFNFAAGSLAIWISAHLFRSLLPASPTPYPLEQLLIPVFLLATTYFAINSSLIAIAVACEKALSPIGVWKDNFVWIGLNYIGGACVAMLLVTYRQQIDFIALSVIVPLLVITYLTFRTSLGRLEDANRHVAQVNSLYLSTIETLAMAVDAKDQITHGHIRRVQLYAVELAKRLGVNNDRQLKAIEAAALLHDMGKLAIPEHILNKPGKLTPAEFETMKRHAAIGADLLSSIRFPYPVVPIVRYHHEYWNGNGYPTGISGTDIPLGSRILSVVDCFDALNSDRPYRPRLDAHEALAILKDRRGTMYDPLVVDTFIAAYPEIAELADTAGQQARSLIEPSEAFAGGPAAIGPLEEIRASAADNMALTLAREGVLEATSTIDAMNVLSQCARKLTPSTVCAYFQYVQAADELVCVYVSGDDNRALMGLTIRPGERVSGWVAANRKAISNSEATLDLGETATLLRPQPRSTLSVPLLLGSEGELHGVLTGYSSRADPFNHRHVYAFEQLAEALSQHFAKGRPFAGRLVTFTQRHG